MERIGWLMLVLGTWGCANFLLKVVGVRIDSYSAVLGIIVGYTVTGLTLGIAGGGKLGVGWGWIGATAVGACYIVGNWAYLRLARTEDVSVIAPIAGLNTTIPIILGIILLGEPLTVRKLAGIAFAVVAMYLLAGRS